MSRMFENSQLVNKLSQDDPECNYVNRMMEMPTDLLRDIHRTGESYYSFHGIVPTYRLPIGYTYGNIDCVLKERSIYDKMDNKNGININSQNSSNSNSTVRMEIDDHENESQTDEKRKMIETVRGDLILSDDEDDHDYDTPSTANNVNTEENERLLFDTLDACSKKLPNLMSMNLFQRHYKSNKTQSRQIKNNVKQDLPDNASGDTEPFEDVNSTSKQKIMNFIDLLSISTYKKTLATSFQTICNIVNSNKRKQVRVKTDEKNVSPSKLLKLSKVPDKKKDDIVDSQYRIYSKKSVYELYMNIVPDLSKDIDIEKLNNISKNTIEPAMEATLTLNSTKPKYVTQDSMPFIKSESSTRKEAKGTEDNSINSIRQFTGSNVIIENNQNCVKKPEAAAKQFFTQSTNYSNYSNNTKVAVVTGKVNKNQSIWQNKTDNINKPTTLPSLQINTNNSFQRQPQSQSSRSLAFKDSNENDADESKVVQGLMAMTKMRTYFKSDFIQRMRSLEIDKWLKEVHSLKEKAFNCKGQLDYAPQIMVYIRKNLFYNYSLEVKNDYGTSHKTYLENASIIKQSCSDITQIYNEHEKDIMDKNSIRLWNIKLVKHFTVIMCHRLSAILQYRAFRNVSEDCRKIHETLLRSGVIDKNDHTNALVTDNHQHSSPFSVLSSYSPGQVSTRNSSPRICNSDNHTTLLNGGNNNNNSNNNGTNLTAEMKAKLQRYINHTTIINSSYSDWMLAEKHHVMFCNRSARHDESWKEFEWKIVEKTGGVVISSIDESIPFVIKYLEGYINYMNEFMKHNL